MTVFYVCNHCGNVARKIVDRKVPLFCCGEAMKEMVPGTVDASQEKHLPVVTVEGNNVTVKVGSVEHPMVEEHYIQFIFIETENGGLKRVLKPGSKPEATFCVCHDKPVAVYEYCNLHGLWKTEV